MKSIILVETKRILKKEIIIFFFSAVLFLSLFSSYQAIKSYELWDMDGVVASGQENLRHGKENTGRNSIEKAISILRDKEDVVFVDETNVAKLVAMNYSDKNVKDLSDEEINLFYENRLKIIEAKLSENSIFTYTDREKERFIEEAEKLTSLMMSFSEGWKVLNQDMGSFVPFVLILVSIVIMPLFAEGSQIRMKELICSTRKGKGQFNLAKIITAFGIGSVLYVSAMLIYFLIKMIPFGCEGGREYIQSNEATFFSVFHVTYMEQFVMNCIRGYVSLIFVVSMTILISVILGRIMEGISVISFYWVLLLIIEKMMSLEVNHIFANFMPLRLSGGIDFYIQNEVYRFAGKTFDGLVWCPLIAVILAVGMLSISIWWLWGKGLKTTKIEFYR